MNIITRRDFFKVSAQAAVAAGIASLLQVPPFLRRALADGTLGFTGNKKILFLFFRGGNDGVNNVIPILDPSYDSQRPVLAIPKHPIGDSLYQNASGPGGCPGLDPQNPGAAIPLCNGFAALHPALGDVVPLYQAGKLAMIHRVAYRSQSRSHFDSEKYWEKGSDGTAANRSIGDGIWYRAIVETGWHLNHSLAGVSIQSNMPQSLRGQFPMTNLSSLNRYDLLGVHTAAGSTNTDRMKLLQAIDAANRQPYPPKDNRSFVYNLGTAFRDTLDIIDYRNPASPFRSNEYYDADGTTHLFPIDSGSDQRGLGANSYGFFQNLKSAAQILAHTDAVISGTEIGGFDTHTSQATAANPHLGSHANLLRRVAWAFHALWRFYSNPAYNSKGLTWDDILVVTMSEFGRTSAENASVGTDHAEASVMYVGGGSVRGGVYGCSLNQRNGIAEWTMGDGGKNGSLFSANSNVGYLRRIIDYRSVFGEIIREHLGLSDTQLGKVIPAYNVESTEHLRNGGMVATTPIVGELDFIG
jgi:uncharacterized protein (DUF1501 family)